MKIDIFKDKTLYFDSIEFGAGDKNKLQGYQTGQRLPTKYDIM